MHSGHKIILVSLILLSLAIFLSAPAVGLAQSDAANQPAIERSWFTQVIDWVAGALQAVVAWVKEQGSQIARAFMFWREEEVATTEEAPAAPPETPQVLGEEAVVTEPSLSDHPPTPSSVEEGGSVIPPSPAPSPSSEDATSPSPTPPVSPPLAGGDNSAPVAPITTPETLTEPTQAEEPKPQTSSSYFIPILARDTVAPTSRITAFSNSSTTSAAFTVSWTGTDTDITGNPEVRSYDIQYQVDSGDWVNWLLETTLMSSSFSSCSDEKTCGFRSRGRDRYGNLEDYPGTADASIYANLSVPANPTVSSPTSGTTYTTSALTYSVTLSGSGLSYNDLVTITKSGATAATTTASLLGTWSASVTLSEGTNSFTLQASESDGDVSSTVAYSLTLDVNPTHDVVINEIAWMGTALSSADEWVELYNASSTAINLTGWTLAASDGGPSITLSGTVASKSYFLLEHTDDTVVFDVTADQTYGGGVSNQMSNSGELLTLRNASSSLIDKVGSSTASWFAGNNTSKASMERKDPTGDGTSSSNWATNDGSLVNGKASDNSTALTATPKSLNSQNTTIPRAITNLQQQWIYTTTSSLKLYWSAPRNADSTATTTTPTYDIRYSTGGGCPVTDSNWSSATQVTGEPTPSSTEGTAQTLTVTGLSTNTSYCFAMKTNNGAEDSSLSNVYTASTYDSGFSTLSFGSDTVSVNTTIATSTKPYLVNRSFTVNAGVTLTVSPGVVIKMNGADTGSGCNSNSVACTITANGTLVLGSASDSINGVVITSSRDDTYAGDANGDSSGTAPAAGNWGLIAADAGTSTLTFNNAIVRYGGVGSQMIRAQNGAQLSITSSILEYSNSYGMSIGGDSTALTLANSTVQNNLDGLGISSLANATITRSTFTGNRRGIAIDTTADVANLVIGGSSSNGNNFYSNNTVSGVDPNAGIHFSDADDTLDARYNWWGSASGPYLDTDNTSDARDGAVDNNNGALTQITVSSYATTAFSVLPSGL